MDLFLAPRAPLGSNTDPYQPVERTLKLKAPPSQFLFFLRNVEAISPHEVRFTLRTPVPFFLEVLAVPTASIVNPKVLAQAKGADLGSRWLSTHTAGSGPYRVSRFEKGQRVTLTPNPHSTRQPEYFHEVNFLTVKDDATRVIQCQEHRMLGLRLSQA